jgi:hypothetical protein
MERWYDKARALELFNIACYNAAQRRLKLLRVNYDQRLDRTPISFIEGNDRGMGRRLQVSTLCIRQIPEG